MTAREMFEELGFKLSTTNEWQSTFLHADNKGQLFVGFHNIDKSVEMLGKEVTNHDCPLELLREQQKYMGLYLSNMGLYLSILEKRALKEKQMTKDK